MNKKSIVSPLKITVNYKSLNLRFLNNNSIESPRVQKNSQNLTFLLLKKKSKSDYKLLTSNKKNFGFAESNKKENINKLTKIQKSQIQQNQNLQINQVDNNNRTRSKFLQIRKKSIQFSKQKVNESPKYNRFRTSSNSSNKKISDSKRFNTERSQNIQRKQIVKAEIQKIINLQIDTTINMKQIYKNKNINNYPQTTKTIMHFNKTFKNNQTYMIRPYEQKFKKITGKQKQKKDDQSKYLIDKQIYIEQTNNKNIRKIDKSFINQNYINKKQQNKNKLSLSIKDFYILKQLGRGQNGRIYSAIHKKTNMFIALKHFQQQKLNIDYLIDEMKIQLFCNHPNILKAYGYIIEKVNFINTKPNKINKEQDNTYYNIFIVMEKGDYNLFSIIKNNKTLEQQDAAIFTEQILQGLKFLHQNKIIHRDIKPQNIILVNGVCKITDFGWSVIGSDQRQTFCGTLQYVSPQVAIGAKYGNKIDLWSVGVLIFQMLTGYSPFDTKNILQNPFLQYKKQFFEKLPLNISKECLQLLQKLMQLNPKNRISIQQALNHSWLKDVKTRKTLKKDFSFIQQQFKKILK